MKMRLMILFCLCTSLAQAQNYGAVSDRFGYFYAFNNGEVDKLEHQPVKSFQAGASGVAYVSNQGDFKIYFEGVEKVYSPLVTDYTVTDGLIGFNSATAIKVFDRGELVHLTGNGGSYKVGDSLMFFEDRFKSTFSVYYQGKVTELETGVLSSGGADVTVGENLAIYKSISDTYKLFYRGQTTEVLTYSDKIRFALGRNVAAFNDPTTQSFAVFLQGEWYDVEERKVVSFQAGDDMVAYKDDQGNLKVFDKNGVREVSSYSPERYWLRDGILCFIENGQLKVFNGNDVTILENFEPSVLQADATNLVYQTPSLGVAGYYNGEKKQVADQRVGTFEIYGNVVSMVYPDQRVRFYWMGEFYDMPVE